MIMKVMIITSSPNIDGLTAACGQAAKEGVETAGAEAVMVRLNDLDIGKCHACDNGWGTCNKEHTCQIEDDFQKLHASVNEMDAYIWITPVYWGEMSEAAKAFFDRLRRCEASKENATAIQNKPVISVAAAGGRGGGTLTCLSSMERLVHHMRGIVFDLISITQKSRNYKISTIRAAAQAMAESYKK
jgi:multimeric flavodoxin WrbA